MNKRKLETPSLPLNGYNLATFVATVVLLFLGVVAGQSATGNQQSTNIANGYKATELLLNAVENLAAERGLAYTVLRSKQSPKTETLEAIKQARDRSNDAFKQAVSLIKAEFTTTNNARLTAGIEDQLLRIQRLRATFDKRSSQKGYVSLKFQWFEITSRAIEVSNDLMYKVQNELRRAGVGAEASRIMQLQRLVLAMSDYAGRERAVISGEIAGQKAIPSAYKSLQRDVYRSRVQSIWRKVKYIASQKSLSSHLNSLVTDIEKQYFKDLEKVRKALRTAHKSRVPYPVSASSWFEQSTKAIEKMMDLARKAGHAAQFKS